MSSVRQFFEQPGLWFNVFSLVLTALGAGLGVWALWLAYVQLRRIARAADAAKAAAERALAEVRGIASVVDLERLSGLCREVTTLLRSDRRLDAVRPLHDLRIGLARARSGRGGGDLFVPTDEWDATLAEVALIQRRLGRSLTVELADLTVHKFADRIADLDQRLNELSPKAFDSVAQIGG